MLIYKDKTEIISKVEVKNQHSDISNHFKGKKIPQAIIMDVNDDLYFIQNFDEMTTEWLMVFCSVYLN